MQKVEDFTRKMYYISMMAKKIAKTRGSLAENIQRVLLLICMVGHAVTIAVSARAAYNVQQGVSITTAILSLCLVLSNQIDRAMLN